MRGTKTVIERMESADRINELDQLLKEREDLKSEVERAKSDRNAEGMRVRGELLPKLQAMADELEKQGHSNWVKLEIVKRERDAAQSELAVAIEDRNARERELKEAQAAAAVMRVAIDTLRDSAYWRSAPAPKTVSAALATTAGTAFLARMAEWLVVHSRWNNQSREWISRQQAFIKGEGVKA